MSRSIWKSLGYLERWVHCRLSVIDPRVLETMHGARVKWPSRTRMQRYRQLVSAIEPVAGTAGAWFGILA
jgi:hypothetical protein